MSKSPIIVLGAGPAGLAFAKQFGEGCVVLERDSRAGGLCQSITIEDGVFDLGGHSFHTPFAHVKAFVSDLMGDNWYEQKRDARVAVGDALIPYPYQHHFEQLNDLAISRACMGHVPDAEKIANSQNFEEWIYNRFGTGVAEHFMLPYNRKLWARDLKGMAFDWVDQRIATDKNQANQAPALERRPLQSDSTVSYPRRGGFGEIFVKLAEQCHHIEYGQEVIAIDPENKTIQTRNGKVWHYSKIVSTLPIKVLLKQIKNCPSELNTLADNLKAVSIKVLMLLVHLNSKQVPQRIYCADPEIPSHKIAFNHTSSPELAARDQHAIMCEISYSEYKKVGSDQELATAMTNWLIQQKFIDCQEDVLKTQVVDLPFGYPVNTHDKEKVVNTIKQYLDSIGINSIGRFGGWEYINSDECIRQGIELAKGMA
jgi:UDP-galactopyranose mutase